MKKFRPIAIVPLSVTLLIMVSIFVSSAQPGTNSGELSFGMSYVITKTIFTEVPENIPDALYLDFSDEPDTLSAYVLYRAMNIEAFLRKAAHFFIYLLLGLSVFFSCYLLVEHKKLQIFISLIFCTLYAVSDEVHQLFVPGRAGMIEDVLLDAAGSICGIALALLCVYKLNRVNSNDIA